MWGLDLIPLYYFQHVSGNDMSHASNRTNELLELYAKRVLQKERPYCRYETRDLTRRYAVGLGHYVLVEHTAEYPIGQSGNNRCINFFDRFHRNMRKGSSLLATYVGYRIPHYDVIFSRTCGRS